MNSTIEKLWQQAAQRDDYVNETRHEKFAMLVVQECIEQIKTTYAGSIHSHAGAWNAAVEKALKKIKNHFSIEEPVKRPVIGYCERDEGYYPMYAPEKGSIVTQAFILCKYCNGTISPVSGPRYDAVCLTCYEKEPDER